MKTMRSMLKPAILKLYRLGQPNVRVTDKKWTHKRIQIPGKQVFCGYYDLPPFSADENQILLHVIEQNADPEKCPASLVLYDLASNQVTQITKTDLWCWQLGSRLCWLDRQGEKIAANLIYENDFGAAIWQKTDQGFTLEKHLSSGVFDWSSDGKLACSLNFARLDQQRPGYGYRRRPDANHDKLVPENDGVFVIEVERNKRHLIYSIADAVKLCGMPRDRFFYINHISWNQSATRLLFFLVGNDGKRRTSAAIIIDPDGSNPWVWHPHQTISVSHYHWENDRDLIITATLRDHGFGFYQVTDKIDNQPIRCIPNLRDDGHPTQVPNMPGHMLTDTYPDTVGEQSLLIVNKKCGAQQKLARFYAPPAFVAAQKCDLHPRMSASGKKICVDTCYDGQRGVSVLSLSA